MHISHVINTVKPNMLTNNNNYWLSLFGNFYKFFVLFSYTRHVIETEMVSLVLKNLLK